MDVNNDTPEQINRQLRQLKIVKVIYFVLQVFASVLSTKAHAPPTSEMNLTRDLLVINLTLSSINILITVSIHTYLINTGF